MMLLASLFITDFWIGAVVRCSAGREASVSGSLYIVQVLKVRDSAPLKMGFLINHFLLLLSLE